MKWLVNLLDTFAIAKQIPNEYEINQYVPREFEFIRLLISMWRRI